MGKCAAAALKEERFSMRFMCRQSWLCNIQGLERMIV